MFSWLISNLSFSPLFFLCQNSSDYLHLSSFLSSSQHFCQSGPYYILNLPPKWSWVIFFLLPFLFPSTVKNLLHIEWALSIFICHLYPFLGWLMFQCCSYFPLLLPVSSRYLVGANFLLGLLFCLTVHAVYFSGIVNRGAKSRQ